MWPGPNIIIVNKNVGSEVCLTWNSLLRLLQEWNKGSDYEEENQLVGKLSA